MTQASFRRTALAGLVAVALFLAWITGLAGLALHAFALRDQDGRPAPGSLGLGDYRTTIEARPVHGIGDNISGLTFSAATGTLFATVNRPSLILELSTEGTLLRRIAVEGAGDMEAITHVGGETFIVADEATGRLSWITIGAGTGAVDIAAAPGLVLDGRTLPNLGIEGLSWDGCRDRLFIAREMWPVRVAVVGGIAKAAPGAGAALTVSEWQPRLALGHSFADLSSVSVLDGHGGVLLLSHLTSALAEFSPDGRPLGLMLLWPGRHGLSARVPQAEGLAVGGDGTVYIVSEPNLFYRFTPRAAGPAGGNRRQPAPCTAPPPVR